MVLWYSIVGDKRPVPLPYQQPANSYFLSEQISHQPNEPTGRKLLSLCALLLLL
jgi:hypothetical protein